MIPQFFFRKKEEVFDELGSYLPIPTRETGIYREEEVEETKDILRQTFIARNLIYPAINLKAFVDPEEIQHPEYKEEAFALYRSIESLKRVHARAVINYLYTSALEHKLFGYRLIMDRVERRPASPTMYGSLIYMITPRIVRIEGVKTPPKVPNFPALAML